MNIRCKFVLEYPDADYAEKIRDALEVDNYRFIETKLEENILIAKIDSKSFMSLLHTIEDYLSCLITAENVVTQTSTEIIEKE